jgi:flagellar hook-associated protein 3 FlgL
MRITSNITSDNSLYNIQQGRAKLDKINELISSGNNVNRPSDDPINTRLLLEIGDKIKTGDQYISNIGKASTWQQYTSTALTGMSDVMNLAHQAASSISGGNSDAAARQDVVAQLQELKQQLADLGNMQLGDQYIFGGANNTTPPFSTTPPYYAGDETALKIEIAPNTTQQMNIQGNQLLTADTSASQPYGAINIFKAFDNLITAVNANDVSGMQVETQALEDGSRQLISAQSDVKSRLTRLDSMKNLNENSRSTLSTIYSNTQNVDYAKMAVLLNKQQTAFEASLSSTAKISQLSLLNYLPA